MEIRPIGGCFAAEVLDVQLATVGGDAFEAIEQAFYDHSVLVFHDQQLNEEEHAAFSRRFGDLEMTMVNDPSGGETEFACMRAAYETLSDEERDAIENLVVEHDIAFSRATIDPNMLSDAFRKEVPPQLQSLVRMIPETGRKTFYAGAHAARVAGWPEKRSRALIDKLNALATKPEFVYQHKWAVNDLVMWDNRCCLHRGRAWDGSKFRRVMRRTTIAGDGPTVSR
ncbi:MAG: TauD/TfdA family dioxygenase [Gammaproteobacteria bacterium]|nr:TauD/TfdA family dioxygenase [Gammaproteobacteria bacterium]MDX2461431.1 TauD/TfdA family dioxygenase [Gammaproteobacteria bacterium]